MRAASIFLLFILAGCEDDETSRLRELTIQRITQDNIRRWEETAAGEPLIIRICPNGQKIYKSRVNGKFYDDPPEWSWAREIQNPETVCGIQLEVNK